MVEGERCPARVVQATPSDPQARATSPASQGRKKSSISGWMFRPATAADIPALHALIEAAYRGDVARAGWTHEADLLDGQRTDLAQLAAIMADAKQTFLIAEHAHACVLVIDNGDSALLSMLAVHPAAQARGMGAALIAAAEFHARDKLGHTCAQMRVIAQRPELIAYYARRGYAPTGATVPFPYGNPGFGIPRRDDLVLCILEKPLLA